MTREEVQQNQQDTRSASDKVHYDNALFGLPMMGAGRIESEYIGSLRHASAQSPADAPTILPDRGWSSNPHASPISPSHANQSTLHAYQGDAGDEC